MPMPANQPWPPVPPDLDRSKMELEMPPLSVSANSEIYLVKGRPAQVYKARAMPREYELQEAAGDCAIPVRGRVLTRVPRGEQNIIFCGFMMDRAAPIPKALSPSLRRDLMHQMIHAVGRLHDRGIVHGDVKLQNMLVDNHGNLRLSDFAEGRYVDEDESLWEGMTTWHYQSPNRRARGEQLGYYPPPPTIEDDLFGLGLSIWELYTGKMPHEDMALDDLGLRDRQLEGTTVDVAEVDDPEARDIITRLLRQGGARV